MGIPLVRKIFVIWGDKSEAVMSVWMGGRSVGLADHKGKADKLGAARATKLNPHKGTPLEATWQRGFLAGWARWKPAKKTRKKAA